MEKEINERLIKDVAECHSLEDINEFISMVKDAEVDFCEQLMKILQTDYVMTYINGGEISRLSTDVSNETKKILLNKDFVEILNIDREQARLRVESLLNK